MAGLPNQARLVGYVLHALPEGTDIPWHRVVNARGAISLPPDSFGAAAQRALLEAEGLVFDRAGRLPLDRCRWPGAASSRRDRQDPRRT